MPNLTTELLSPHPRIAVDHAGDGPLVVFLHGVGGNRTFWHDQLTALAPHFQAVSWDARGYGSSDDYEGPFEFADVCADLIRVIDHFGASTAHVIGLSLGGMIAMDFHNRYPDRVATLTLCDTAKGFEGPPEVKQEFIRLRQAPLLAGKEPRDLAPDVARSLMSRTSSEQVYQFLHDGYAALHKQSFLKTIEAGANAMIDLTDVRVPTHVIVGDQDLMAPPSISRQICEAIPGAELSIIPDAGHISNIDQPAAFNKVVLEFLMQHRS